MPHRQQPKKTTLADSARFLSQWFQNPGVVGAVAPSGPALAKAMASYVDLARKGPIVELGPGTGPVTKALLARGIPADRLLLVEYETRFCRMLAERYPGVKIVQGDAYGLKATLADHVDGEVATVISSLPLLNRPERDRVRVAASGIRPDGAGRVVYPVHLRAGDFADARPRPWPGGSLCRQGFGAGSAEHTAGAGVALSPRRSFRRPGQVTAGEVTASEVTASEAKARDRLIVALDVESVEAARTLISKLGDSVSFYKIGLELAYAGGIALASELKQADKRVFLDLKLHDIGATVERATRQIARLGVDFLTIHGFTQTMRAARAGAGDEGLRLLAVTVMTSYDDADLREAGYALGVAELAALRATQAGELGVDGLILSPLELGPIRALVGPKMLLVTPGVRPAGADANDQKRVMTPGQAIQAGADHLVIGRPITRAADPRAAARRIVVEIAGAA